MSPGATLEASSEAVPRAPLRRQCFRLSDEEDDDGPRSEVGEGDLVEIRRRYLIPESVEFRCAGEFERAPDGGTDEVAIFEAYIEAGFRGGIPSLIAEVSSYFAFSPSQLTPSTWHTLIAIQVLGELHGIPFGRHPFDEQERVLRYLVPDGESLVNEPLRGIRGGFPFGDLWNRRYVFMKVNGTPGYLLFWRSVEVARPLPFASEALVKLAMEIPRRFQWVPFFVSRADLRHSRIWGEIFSCFLIAADSCLTLLLFVLTLGGIPRVPISSIYDDYHKTRSWKRQPYFPPSGFVGPPSVTPSMSFVPERSGGDRPIGLRRRVPQHEEVLFLRAQLRDVVSHQIMVVKWDRAFARWELMKEWSERNISHWDPDGEYRRLLSLGGGGTWIRGFPLMAPPSNRFRP
ncbi:LOW QUALITY PROTEIN: hypothetical protein Bca101_059204 [Brassica carinata]